MVEELDIRCLDEDEAHHITLEELLPPGLSCNLHTLILSSWCTESGRKENNQTTPNAGHSTEKTVLFKTFMSKLRAFPKDRE